MQADSLEDAVGFLQAYREETALLAGGTDILLRMKSRLDRPKYLLNLKDVFGLRGIKRNESGIEIGSLTTISDILDSPLVAGAYGLLKDTCKEIASPQIRNVGTVGGNLCQQVWCPYYRNGFLCWLNGGKICPAVLRGGDNRWYQSIFGGDRCLAAHPSDLAIALLALDADVELCGPGGYRTLKVDQLLPGVKREEGRIRFVSIRGDEILSKITIGLKPDRFRYKYAKFRLRRSWDFAIVGIAVAGTMENGVCSNIRIALGGVATKPYRCIEAEKILECQPPESDRIEAAAQAAFAKARPFSQNQFKVDIGKALVRRALSALRLDA